jgi:quercetin dioxygenase-like cupin family protein
MPLRRTTRAGALLLASVLACALAGCTDSKDSVAPHAPDAAAPPSFTLGSGSTSTLLGRATFSDPNDQNFKVKRITGDWHVEIKGKPAVDLAVQSIVFQPGSHSGWHRHPGPVFIQVVSGTMTFYESDDPRCTPVVRTAGQGFLDVGDHAHIARNETATPAQNIVTYFAPPGATLRIDAPNPGNCPF